MLLTAGIGSVTADASARGSSGVINNASASTRLILSSSSSSSEVTSIDSSTTAADVVSASPTVTSTSAVTSVVSPVTSTSLTTSVSTATTGSDISTLYSPTSESTVVSSTATTNSSSVSSSVTSASGVYSPSQSYTASASGTPTAVPAIDGLTAYWGVQSGEKSLAYYCQRSSVKTYIIGYVDQFGLGQDLGMTIADYDDYFSGTKLLDASSTIGEDIKTCHELGRNVMLGLGGPSGTYGFSSAADGQSVASALYNTFGAGTTSQRPFGTVVVDGYQLDLQNAKTSLRKRDVDSDALAGFLNGLTGAAVGITVACSDSTTSSAITSSKISSITIAAGETCTTEELTAWAEVANSKNAKVNLEG